MVSKNYMWEMLIKIDIKTLLCILKKVNLGYIIIINENLMWMDIQYV